MYTFHTDTQVHRKPAKLQATVALLYFQHSGEVKWSE